jgi:hypothetical protein
MKLIKDIGISLVVAYFVRLLEVRIDSDFLIPFLTGNLVTILIALLAINAATLGIILTKLRDISDALEEPQKFNGTRKEMLKSLHEQIILIALSGLVLILLGSRLLVLAPFFIYLKILLVSIFVYAMLILYDTAKGVFVLLKGEK